MSDAITGETPKPEADASPKTYTEEEVKELLGNAKKEGQTEAYRHWQSVNDRVISAERGKNEALNKELKDYRDKAFEALSPEEQNKALMREVRDKLDKPTAPKAEEPSDPAGVNVRESVNATLKEAGLDPSKIDWADDAQGPEAMKRFLKSIVTQVKPAEVKPSEEEVEANRVDSSKSAGGSIINLKDIDTRDLISKALSKPFKG